MATKLGPMGLPFALAFLSAARVAAVPISAMPPAVNFPDTGVGAQSVDVTITFTNTSNANATLTGWMIIGANPQDFVNDTNLAPPIALAPTTSVQMPVAFRPSAIGARSATLEVTLGNGLGVVDVPLSGNGLGPKLTVVPNPINAGGSKINVTTPVPVTISNAGGNTVTIPQNGIVINGTNANEFVLVNAPNGATVLGPAGQGALNLTINYTPTFQGNHSANLAITNNDPNLGPTMNVPITGKAGDPAISTDVGTVAFGNVRVDLKSGPQTITVTNTGNSDLHITQITVGNGQPGDFPIMSPQLPLTLPIGQSALISAAFKPSAVGQRMARIVITSDDPVAPNKVVNMLGTGTMSILAVQQQALDFGSQLIQQASNPQNVTVQNTGSDFANITGIAFGGNQAGWFRTGGLVIPPIKVPAMNSVSIPIVALPLGAGAGTATLTITTDDPNTPSFMVPLKVNGVAPMAALNPKVGDFGAIAVNTISAPMVFTLDNAGNAVLTVIDFNLIDNNQVFMINNPIAANTQIGAGKSVTFSVTFSPPAPGNYSGEIDLRTDDPVDRSIRIPLAGVGVVASLMAAPAQLGFPAAFVKTVSSPQPVSVHNTGGTAIVISSVGLSGADAAQFVSDEMGPFTLQPGATRTIQVVYEPLSVGAHAATLGITPKGFSVISIRLSGTAVVPMLQVAAAMGQSIDFGSLPVGTTSMPQTLGVKNASPLPVTVRWITPPDPAFLVDTVRLPMMLAPQAVAMFNVTFAPAVIGPVSGTLTVQLNELAGDAASMMVKGAGIALPDMAQPEAVDMATGAADAAVAGADDGGHGKGLVIVGRSHSGCSAGAGRPIGQPTTLLLVVAIAIALAACRRARMLPALCVGLTLPLAGCGGVGTPISRCFCDPGYTCDESGQCVLTVPPDYAVKRDLSLNPPPPDMPDMIVLPDLANLPPDLAPPPAPPCVPPCAINQFCVNGHCTGCRMDADCPMDEYCRTLGGGLAECAPGCTSDQRCGGAMKCCGGQCVDLRADARNCGSCGKSCAVPHAASSCNANQCQLGACDQGWDNCDGNDMNGCETSLLADVNNCTACGMACKLSNAVNGCANGCFIAACNFGFDDCNADPRDGCETSVLSDVRNCGGCGVPCAAPPHGRSTCANATCQLTACDAGYSDCDGNPKNGCESATGSDINNCGRCGNQCAQGLVCVNSSCTCAMCNIPNAKTKCVNNQCVFDTCLAGFADCNNNVQDGCEVNLNTDKNNCSACGNACPMNMPSCVNAQCGTGMDFGPMHTFAGLTSSHFITQGCCSVNVNGGNCNGTIDDNAKYFCIHFYGQPLNLNCTPVAGYKMAMTPNCADAKMHKNGGCTGNGNNIANTTCDNGPCKIGNWNECTTGVTNLVCHCQ